MPHIERVVHDDAGQNDVHPAWERNLVEDPDAGAFGQDRERQDDRRLDQVNGCGSDGAYGGGVLAGWSEAGTRPEFAVVTGVSQIK